MTTQEKDKWRGFKSKWNIIKKSILWRAILTFAILVAWTSLLFPIKDQPYLETFRRLVSYPESRMERILKERLEDEILKKAQAQYVLEQQNPAYKEFNQLPESLQSRFYQENILKIRAEAKNQWERMPASERKRRIDQLRQELETRLNRLLEKAELLEKENRALVKKAEEEHLKNPDKPLVPRRSIESIILELASGDSKEPGFDQYISLADYITMYSKEHPSNADIVYFVRNRSRGKIKLGLDLKGGTEFTLSFASEDVEAFNKLQQGGRSLSETDIRDRIIEILRNRIDPQGVKEVEIRANGPTGITIRTPITDPAEIMEMKEMLERQAKLHFHIVHPENEQLIREDKKSVPGYIKLPLRAHSGQKMADSRLYVWVKEQPEQVSGEHVVEAYPSRNQLGQWIVIMRFNTKGAAYMQSTTSQNIGQRMAIVLDNVVYSAPVIQSAISGNGEITGDFTQQEAHQLAIVLQSGSLPVKVRLDSQMNTSPTLGEEYIQSGLKACVIGMILVIVFMIFYYRVGGIVANIALLGNILLIFGSLPLLGASLTLPGIAGIVLTIGMAVDANVLIFERMREELAKGKRLVTALKNGYSQAFWTIFDANLTTLVTAFFLYHFGSGTIKGFAVTLSLGILASMFTALFVTRWIFDLLVETEILTDGTWLHSFIHGLPGLKNKEISFIAHQYKFIGISLFVILLSVGVMVWRGKDALSVDFLGGVQLTMSYKQRIPLGDITTTLEGLGFKNAKATYKDTLAGGASILEIIVRTEKENDPSKINKIGEDLSQVLHKKFPQAEFGIPNLSVVGGLISSEFQKQAIIAIVLSLIAMILYISFRFEFAYAAGAVGALVHDILICTGIFLIWDRFSREISLTVIAGLLTIIGYSLNDTIVVFDRIRENLSAFAGKKINRDEFTAICNKSINETLTRTILTSLTTLLVVVILYLIGGGAINDFSIIMLVGIIVGTYSSIFIATPLMIYFHFYIEKVMGEAEEMIKQDLKEKRRSGKVTRALAGE